MKDKIKVIQVIHTPGFGGLEMVVLEFHQWLLKNNIEAHLFTIKDGPLDVRLTQKNIPHIASASAKETFKRIAKDFDSPNTTILLHRQQEVKKLGLRRYQSKICVMSHTFYGVKKTDLLHRLIFSRVDQWIALTKSHKENLIETAAIESEKIATIPNGVDLEFFKPIFKTCPVPDRTVRLAVIARLDPQKGQEIAIQALSELKKQNTYKFELFLFGEDTPNEKPVKPTLEALAKSLRVENEVRFVGFISDLHAALREIDLLWMPSYKETFGRCIIEAMAMGLPVVASRAGGVVDIIVPKKNGLLFETKNPQDLAEKTLAILSDARLFSEIQKQARLDVEANYDKESIWKKLLGAITPHPKQ